MTFELKEQALNAFASQIYSDLVVSFERFVIPFQKTKEELAKEAGMMKGLITKIIDNLQIQI